MHEFLPDLAYGREPRQAMDLFLPEASPAPLFVFVHGGGWRGGDKQLYRPLGAVLAENGFAVALPNHRLAPAHEHPAQVEDVAQAVACARRYAGESGVKRDGIVIGGHSSGAHLAALLALHPRYGPDLGLGAGCFSAVVCISGVYDLPPYAAFAGDYLTGVFGSEIAGLHDASPLRHVRAGAPPFFLACAQYDYPGAAMQARNMARTLQAAGGEARFLEVPERNHLTILTGVQSALDPLALGLTMFLREHR